MKRLTDQRVAEIQENEGTGRIDNPEYKTAGELDSLFRDHLQAREDRKRLVQALRDLAPFRAHPGGCFCWCAEDQAACLRSEDKRPTQETCINLNALLADVSTP